MKITLIRCPQPRLIGSNTGARYGPNRELAPEPSLPVVNGIIDQYSLDFEKQIDVDCLDLRYPKTGNLKEVVYDELKLPYIKEKINKVYYGVPIEDVFERVKDSDIIGFTNNFTMSRNIVLMNIKKIREMFPNVEIWIGGRDVFTRKIEELYLKAVNYKNVVIFRGHTFFSLPEYLNWRTNNKKIPNGIVYYDINGVRIIDTKQESLREKSNNQELNLPLPSYFNPDELSYFMGSGEGMPDSENDFERFAHLTISFGCPNQCGYCTTGYRERYLVYKSKDCLKKELELLKSLNVKTIAIMDDNLLVIKRDVLIDYMNLINSYGFNIEYGNGLQLSILKNNWDELKEPILKNCVSLYCPLEDLTQNKFYEKLDPIENQLELMRLIVNYAPNTRMRYLTMGVIIGVPGHTKEKLYSKAKKNMIKFLNVFKGSKLKIAITVFNFMPLIGTLFGDTALNSNRMILDAIEKDPEIINFEIASYVPDGMNAEDIPQVYEDLLNLNPAGKSLGITYFKIKRFGINALPDSQKHNMPSAWKHAGMHYRDNAT